jgi:hypothetical protein
LPGTNTLACQTHSQVTKNERFEYGTWNQCFVEIFFFFSGDRAKQARVFAPSKSFQPRFIFAGKARSLP